MSKSATKRHAQKARWTARSSAGMTILELIVACGILVVLSGMAVPMARVQIKRQREARLRYDVLEMRNAIDRYKDAADQNLIRVQAGTEGYPPDLQTLVDGVQLAGAPDRHVRFLREIPVDPMTGTKDWGLRSVQDDADATNWGGQDVFDVYSKSMGTALDGTKYADW
ncbi:MAG: type II secretion system protein [Candidatus Acidiferrales bacterium]